MSLLSSKRALMAQALQRLLLDSGSLVLFSVYFIFQTLLTHGYLSKVACTSLALFLKHQEQMHTWYPASSNFTRACSLQLVILFPVSRVLWKSTMTLLRSPLLTTSPSSRVVLLPEAVLDSFFSPAFSEAPPFSEALPFSEATPLSDIFPISGVLLLLWPLLSLFPSPRVSFISWWCVFFFFIQPLVSFFLFLVSGNCFFLHWRLAVEATLWLLCLAFFPFSKGEDAGVYSSAALAACPLQGHPWQYPCPSQGMWSCCSPCSSFLGAFSFPLHKGCCWGSSWHFGASPPPFPALLPPTSLDPSRTMAPHHSRAASCFHPSPHPTHHPSHGLMGCRGGPPPPPHWPCPFWPLPCLLSLFHRVYLLCSGLGWNLQVGSSMPSIQSCFWAASLLQGYPSSREIFPLARVIKKTQVWSLLGLMAQMAAACNGLSTCTPKENMLTPQIWSYICYMSMYIYIYIYLSLSLSIYPSIYLYEYIVLHVYVDVCVWCFGSLFNHM